MISIDDFVLRWLAKRMFNAFAQIIHRSKHMDSCNILRNSHATNLK